MPPYSKEALLAILLVGLIIVIVARMLKPSGEKIAEKPVDTFDRGDLIDEKRELESERNKKILDQPSPSVVDVNTELERLRRDAEQRRKLDS